ncbi:MAG: DHH family phosphoesterase [bacterium]|nr:DHH family phosphoesterase [bacterium]
MDYPLLKEKDFSHKYFKIALRTIKSSSRILVWGDEDADGMTSTALLVRALRDAGKNTDYFIPSRTRDGIGITDKGIDRIKRKKFDCLITVDCGTVNYDAIKKLLKRKIKVIITDHHVPHSRLVEKVPYINPHILRKRKFMNLSGAGVAYIFSWFLLKKLKSADDLTETWHENKKNLSLAALGTICDRVPDSPLNRELMYNIGYFMKEYREFKKAGVSKNEICSIVTSSKTVRTRHTMVDIFIENRGLTEESRLKHIKTCKKNALDYKTAVERICNKLIDRINYDGFKNRILLIEKRVEYKYIGVAASKLTEKFEVPVCIIGTKGKTLSGECRAKNPYNWVKKLEGQKEYFLSWGGHPQAAGFTLKGEMLERFVDAFNSDSD